MFSGHMSSDFLITYYLQWGWEAELTDLPVINAKKYAVEPWFWQITFLSI